METWRESCCDDGRTEESEMQRLSWEQHAETDLVNSLESREAESVDGHVKAVTGR